MLFCIFVDLDSEEVSDIVGEARMPLATESGDTRRENFKVGSRELEKKYDEYC